MAKEFKIQNDTNPWDVITIADDAELVVGTKVYEGERSLLIGGVETTIADRCYGGTYLLEEGKSVEVADGIIVEINEVPVQASMKSKVSALKEKIKAKRS